ncbi:MAG: glycosyltransferase [Gallionella sp.]
MQLDQPLVSVLMNCYNGEKYLRAALDSVLAQTYQNWELVFWDNQSTDDSAAICKSYADRRIRYFYASEHTELGPARIQAFQQIRGEFVAVLDADDISHPDRLARQVAFLKQHPDVALVGSWAQYIDEKGKIFDEFKPPSDRQELQDCLGWTNPIIHSSAMYRCQLAHEAGGYPENIVWAQDFGLTLALAQRAKIAMIADYLCQLRVLTASMTRSRKYQTLIANELLLLFKQAADTLQLSAKARRLNRRTMAIAEIKLGIATLSADSFWAGLKMILHGFVTDPSALWGNGPTRRFFGAKF